MKVGKNTSRFNFLLTPEQKSWLSKKASGFTSAGDIVRNLIQEAMDSESTDDKSA